MLHLAAELLPFFAPFAYLTGVGQLSCFEPSEYVSQMRFEPTKESWKCLFLCWMVGIFFF